MDTVGKANRTDRSGRREKVVGAEILNYKARIIERNKLMISKSDYVITHVKHFRNARALKQLAEKQEKIMNYA